MQTPVQIEFQGLDTNANARDAIDRHVGELEQRFGRITSCRIAIRAPSAHHRSGGLYEVAIRLAMPHGREVNIDRTATRDERRADLAFAINDAFKRARRRLQDQARRMRGQVKMSEIPPVAKVVTLDPSGEFGFLEAPDGREIYFHRNSVLNSGFDRLAVGAQVAFAEEMGEKGPQASTVRLLGKHGLRL